MKFFKFKKKNAEVNRDALILWSSSLSVYNEEIDNQHKKLIQIINTTYKNSFSKEFSRIGFELVVKELCNYTEYHFDSEEKFMQKILYPNYDEHKTLHTQFIREILNYTKLIDFSNKKVCRELLSFLMNWLANHIIIHDKNFGDFHHFKYPQA
jgi:hemerythrin